MCVSIETGWSPLSDCCVILFMYFSQWKVCGLFKLRICCIPCLSPPLPAANLCTFVFFRQIVLAATATVAIASIVDMYNNKLNDDDPAKSSSLIEFITLQPHRRVVEHSKKCSKPVPWAMA